MLLPGAPRPYHDSTRVVAKAICGPAHAVKKEVVVQTLIAEVIAGVLTPAYVEELLILRQVARLIVLLQPAAASLTTQGRLRREALPVMLQLRMLRRKLLVWLAVLCRLLKLLPLVLRRVRYRGLIRRAKSACVEMASSLQWAVCRDWRH